MKKIKVNLDRRTSHSYEICTGTNILDRIGVVIAKNNAASRYAVISDSNVAPLYGEQFLTLMRKMGLNATLLEIAAGETSKNMETTLSVVGKLIALGIDRDSVLIALGGGVIGDLTGFIASLYMRSIPYIQIPTSLLAQVDSSIGGKTGIDLPEGKNLLGTFYQPKMVFIDLHFLATLPEEEFNNGLAEIVKYGIIDDRELFAILEEKIEAVKNRDMDILEMIVRRAGKIKKGIVEIDEKDVGIRRILNFGHTIGHALEASSEYTVSHGNAVAVGMIAAARTSEKLHHLSPADRSRIEHLISAMGLLDHIPEQVKTADIISRMRSDKKKKGDAIHFVLLKKIGVPFINGSVDEGLVQDIIEELR